MLGNKIRELRTTNNYTQEDLANKLKISKSTIGMYEQNRRVPDLDTLAKLADIFDVTIDYLTERIPTRLTNEPLHSYKIHWNEVIELFPNAAQLTPEEKELISYYNELSLKDKRWIMGQMIDLIKRENENIQNCPKAQ